MADQQPVGNPVPTNAIPIAAKDELGNLEYLTIDAAGSLNVNVGGALGSAVTIADGADVTEGAIADAKVVGDNSGTVSAKLRGLNYLINLVTDTVNSWVKVSIQNTSILVRQGAPVAAYDYTSLAPAATQDVWTFKTGGAGGATVQTVTINYTDATKTVITDVTWT